MAGTSPAMTEPAPFLDQLRHMSLSERIWVNDRGYIRRVARRSQWLRRATSQAAPKTDAFICRPGNGRFAFDCATPMPDARLPLRRNNAESVNKQQCKRAGHRRFRDPSQDAERDRAHICWRHEHISPHDSLIILFA
jgi:hypothetical protein